MTNAIAISRIFMKGQWKFLPWWLLSKSEYNEKSDLKTLEKKQ